jgi:DNA-binding transcriptional LysR family regulator
MIAINMDDIKNLDLNLLRVLVVVLSEKSVSRAAERLHRGQPAISSALARLRELFRDELLVRTGRRMVPTPKAEALLHRLAPLMSEIEQAFYDGDTFNPTTSKRIFRLGLPDDQEAVVLQPLIGMLSKKAPQTRLTVRSTTYETVSDQIDSDEFDLAVSVLDFVPKPWHETKTIGEVTFCCLFNQNLVNRPLPLSVHDYVRFPHVLVSYDGQFVGIVDRALKSSGHSRTIQVVIPRFSAIPSLLTHQPFVATVPEYVASHFAKVHNLTFCPVPLPIESYEINLIWHRKRSQDLADIWFRSCVEEIASAAIETR